VVDIEGASRVPGGNIQTWSTNGGDWQKWKIEPTADGWYRIVSKWSGQVLDVTGCSAANGANVQQYTWLNNDCQKWRVEPVGEPLPLATNTFYRLVAKSSGRALDAAGCSGNDGTNVWQWEWWGGNCQRWLFSQTGDGYVTISSAVSGKVLDVEGASRALGANIQMWSANGGDWQKWKVEPTGDGWYRVVSKWSGQVLDVTGCSTVNGGNVQQYTWLNNDCQKWSVEPVGTASSPAATTSSLMVAQHINYYPFGGDVYSMTMGTGLSSKTLRDSMGRVASYGFASTTFSVARDLVGNVTTVTRSSPQPITSQVCPPPHSGDPCYNRTDTILVATDTENYSYHWQTRHIHTSTTYGQTRSYGHDGYGNLTSGPSGSFAMAAYNNHLLDRNYGFGGRVTSDPYNVLGYDIRGNLASVSNNRGTWTYAYDAGGLRASKTSNGYSIYYHYDAAGHLIAESDSKGIWLKEYIWLGERPLMLIVPALGNMPEVRYYIQTDYANTPVALTDSAGAIMWEWKRGPYGEGDATTIVPGFSFNLRMMGQYYDAESGYFYNQARYYDPRSGRFLQPDPAGERGSGAALYSYTLGNPVNFVDPTGQSPWPVVLYETLAPGLKGALMGSVSAYQSTDGNLRAAAAGAASGFVTGMINPFGPIKTELVSGVTVGAVMNAGLSNVGAQLMNNGGTSVDPGSLTLSLAGHASVMAWGIASSTSWRTIALRGLASGAAQRPAKWSGGEQFADALSTGLRSGGVPFGVSSLHSWGGPSGASLQVYMDPSSFYGGAMLNPAGIVGWPTGLSGSAEDRIGQQLADVLAPTWCTFCN
jgi:RHS repeat-associated protein